MVHFLYFQLACAAMQFLAVMAEREKNQVIFGNEDTLRAICEHVRLEERRKERSRTASDALMPGIIRW